MGHSHGYGKALGIVLMSWLAVKCKLADLPKGVTWKILLGGSCLAGIGFTMALFIAGLAFNTEQDAELLDTAKIGVLLGSILSAAMGVTLLSVSTKGKRLQAEVARSTSEERDA